MCLPSGDLTQIRQPTLLSGAALSPEWMIGPVSHGSLMSPAPLFPSLTLPLHFLDSPLPVPCFRSWWIFIYTFPLGRPTHRVSYKDSSQAGSTDPYLFVLISLMLTQTFDPSGPIYFLEVIKPQWFVLFFNVLFALFDHMILTNPPRTHQPILTENVCGCSNYHIILKILSLVQSNCFGIRTARRKHKWKQCAQSKRQVTLVQTISL